MGFDLKIFKGDYNKEEFYKYMGDIFASKEVRKELPYLYNEPDRIWYIILNGNKIAGFGSMQMNDKQIIFLNDYIIPKYRGKGLYSQIVDIRLKDVSNETKPILVICYGPIVASMYKKRGFIEKKRTKNYIWMCKDGN